MQIVPSIYIAKNVVDSIHNFGKIAKTSAKGLFKFHKKCSAKTFLSCPNIQSVFLDEEKSIQKCLLPSFFDAPVTVDASQLYSLSIRKG